MKNSVSKGILFLTLAALLLLTGLYFFNKGDVVYLAIVEPEYGPELNLELQKLIESEKIKVGVFAYSFSEDGVYELLLVDSRFTENNLYLNTEISARMYDDVLRIKITDSDAVSDEDVAYNQMAYLILKNEPAKIETYLNGEIYEIVIEERQGQIVK